MIFCQANVEGVAADNGYLKNAERFIIGFFASLWPSWVPALVHPVAEAPLHEHVA